MKNKDRPGLENTPKSNSEGNFYGYQRIPFVDPVYEGSCFSIPMNKATLLRCFIKWSCYMRNYEEITPFPLHPNEALVICNTYSSVGEFIKIILEDTRKNHVHLDNYERFLFASSDSLFKKDLDEKERYPHFTLNEFHRVLEQIAVLIYEL